MNLVTFAKNKYKVFKENFDYLKSVKVQYQCGFWIQSHRPKKSQYESQMDDSIFNLRKQMGEN